MQLNFATYQTGAPITASDTGANSFRGLYVGGTGDVALVTSGGDTITLKSVPTGALLPIETAQVLSTGTTATNLVGLS